MIANLLKPFSIGLRARADPRRPYSGSFGRGARSGTYCTRGKLGPYFNPWLGTLNELAFVSILPEIRP
jgi:hypothetical protein